MEKPFAGRYCQFAPRACQNLTVIINRFILHTQTTIFKTIAKRFLADSSQPLSPGISPGFLLYNRTPQKFKEHRFFISLP